MLLTHAPRRGPGNSCVVRVQIHETGTAAWIAHLQLCGSYRSTATATTRAQVFHLPLHREDALRHDVASMAWVCRCRSRTGFICKARGRRAAGVSTRGGLREAAPVARGREVRLRAALRPQSLFRRACEGRRAVPESHVAWGAPTRRAGGTSARRRTRRDGRIADARRAAGVGRREGSRRPGATTKCGASTETLGLLRRPPRRRRARARSTAAAPRAWWDTRAVRLMRVFFLGCGVYVYSYQAPLELSW